MIFYLAYFGSYLSLVCNWLAIGSHISLHDGHWPASANYCLLPLFLHICFYFVLFFPSLFSSLLACGILCTDTHSSES